MIIKAKLYQVRSLLRDEHTKLHSINLIDPFGTLQDNYLLNQSLFLSITHLQSITKQNICYLNMMYHQPHKRDPKKVESQQSNRNQSAEKVNFIQKNRELQSKKKLPQKALPNATIPKPTLKPPQKSIPQKVEHLQKAVQRLSKGATNPDLQKLLLQQIKGIKSELREIKQQIGLNPNRNNSYKSEQDEDEQENIANLVPREEPREVHQPKTTTKLESRIVTQQKPLQSQRPIQYMPQSKKELLDIGKFQPYMKEFKLQPTKMLQPFYTGYHKKSSKPIVLKYCGENESMEALFNLYEKLWKNIVKAKKVCINKVYDLNEPLATNVMALEMNRFSLEQIELPALDIIKEVFRALQFFHQCGYLYRNLHPSHVMMSFDGNIVLLDLKMMRRFVDMKGKLMEVRGSAEKQGMTEFVSNARLRGIAEGRKDDLECLGYLALYLLQGSLPWNLGNMIQVRSKVTLQGLYGKYPGLLEFMISVHKMSTDEAPSYDHLYGMIGS